MKRLFALILVCVLCLGSAALAAEWGEGLSPAKPYQGAREIDLTKQFGYWVFYPSQMQNGKMYAKRFCDVLEVYMPDPNVALGKGTATLWDADNQPVCVIDFSNPDQVQLRDMEEQELENLIWGSGVCLEMFLPISLAFDTEYYVTFEKGVLTTNGGKVECQFIPYDESKPVLEQYWSPMLSDDFGIGSLYYCAAPEEAEEEETEEAEAAADEPKYNPVKGDILNFDVVLGGEAVVAVMYSENDSVYFETMEYDASGHVTGVITDDDVRWGVVFIDADNNVLLNMDMSPIKDRGAEAEAGAEAEEAAENE